MTSRGPIGRWAPYEGLQRAARRRGIVLGLALTLVAVLGLYALGVLP